MIVRKSQPLPTAGSGLKGLAARAAAGSVLFFALKGLAWIAAAWWLAS